MPLPSILLTTGTIIEQLKNDTKLRTLDLRGCGLISLSAKSSAEVISINKTAEHLVVWTATY